MKKALNYVGLVVLLGVAAIASIHLWADHNNFHTNGQLLELVRQTVVEKHPELLQEIK